MTTDDSSSRRTVWPWIVGLLAIGIAYRLVYVFDQVGSLDGDNAVVALMARHIMKGRHYAFFWGQSYMGTIEPYSIAAVAAVFGLNDVVLRTVPLAWGMLYVATFYPLTRLLYGRREAIVALGLAAVAPPLLAVWGPSPRGGYSTMLFLGHVTLILAILLSRERDAGRRDRLALAFGLVAGLAFWTHLLSVVCIAAAAVALFARDPRIVIGRLPWIGAVGFAIGSAPLWIANLASGYGTLTFVGESGRGRKVARAVHDLVTMHGPKLLGMRDVGGEAAVVLPPLGYLVGIMIVLAVLLGAIRALVGVARGIFRGERVIGPEILVWLLVVHLGLDLTSRFGALNTERYLLPAYGAIFPFVAAAVVAIAAGRPVRALLLTVAYSIVIIRGAHALHVQLAARTTFPIHLPEVVDFMQKHGIRFALADHGEALVNTYRSDEAVVLRDFGIGRYPVDEIPGWRIEAVLVRGDGEAMRTALQAMRIPAKAERFEQHALVWNLSTADAVGEPLPKTGWRVHASHGSATASHAIDGDEATRWGSGGPQSRGMSFEIDLAGEHAVTGVRLDGGPFHTDGPRGLRVEGRSDGEWETLVEVPRPQHGLYVEDGELKWVHHSTVEARFAPRMLRALRLVQTGTDRRYDWSIAEADVFTVPPTRADGAPRPAGDTAPRSTNPSATPSG